MPKLNMRKNDELLHYGIEGMLWRHRRFQNEDGSLTEEGRKRYGIGPPRASKEERDAKRAEKKAAKIANKKMRIYKKADAKEIYKNRKLFTTEEYQKAMQRANEFSKYKDAQKVDDGKQHSFKLSTSTPKKDSGNSDVEYRAKIVNSGDPKLVRKNISKLNDQELRSAMEHIKVRAELDKSLSKKKEFKDIEKALKDRGITANGKATVDKLIGVGQTAGKVAASAVAAYKGYNQFASIVNELTGDNKLPTFKNEPWNKSESKNEYGIVTKFTANGKSQTVAKGLDASGTMSDIGNWNADLSDPFGSSSPWTSSSAHTFTNVLYEANDTPIDTLSWENLSGDWDV